MPNYRMLNSVGSWPKGTVVTEKDINNAEALGGLKRLQDLKAVEETTDRPSAEVAQTVDPNTTKGDNVDIGSDDSVEKRRQRRADAVGDINDGTQHGPPPGTVRTDDTGDSAADENPRTGEPGKVAKVSGKK